MRQRQRVTWTWGDHRAEGRVTRKYTDRVTRRIRGSDITRNASEEASAYMIQQDDGDRMLKRHKALRKA